MGWLEKEEPLRLVGGQRSISITPTRLPEAWQRGTFAGASGSFQPPAAGQRNRGRSRGLPSTRPALHDVCGGLSVIPRNVRERSSLRPTLPPANHVAQLGSFITAISLPRRTSLVLGRLLRVHLLLRGMRVRVCLLLGRLVRVRLLLMRILLRVHLREHRGYCCV